MARNSSSRTTIRTLVTRGSARLKDALTTALSSSEVESPSISTIATDTTPSPVTSPSEAPSTSAESAAPSSSARTDLTPLSSLTVGSFVLGPRPLPEFEYGSEGGQFVCSRAAEIGITPEAMLEHMVAWAYRMRCNMGEFTLEELAKFYRDNRPEWWIG